MHTQTPNSDSEVVLTSEDIEVFARRAKIGRYCDLGKRVGYLLLLISTIAFGVAISTSMNKLATSIAAGSLIAACIIMPPAIVFAYGVKAARKQNL